MAGSNDAAAAKSKVIAKALTEPAFKKDLLADPAAAIEKATGMKIPAGIKIAVVEDTASVVHLVLPAAPKPGELSDKDLEGIAGGKGQLCLGTCNNSYNP